MSSLTLTNILLGVLVIEGVIGLLMIDNTMHFVQRILALLRSAK